MHNQLSLDGVWQLAAFSNGMGGWSRISSPYPIPADVPGEVHPALQQAGIIEDPFYGMNSETLQWIEDREWWYRRTFMVPEGFEKSRTFIEFDGLDTFTTIHLNGQLVGASENMFTPCRFDITGKLIYGRENVIEVRLTPALVANAPEFSGYRYRYGAMRIGARKMQCSFGWDWTPRLIGAGIWKSVNIRSYGDISIGYVHIAPEIAGESARVQVTAEVENYTGGPVDASMTVKISGAGPAGVETTVPPGPHTVDTHLTIQNPKLWWPNGYGDQPIYSAEIELQQDGVTVDSRIESFAVRSIEVQQQDENGRPAFIFVINGVPVFIKGANWIPADHFPSRVTPEKYRELLALARDAHFNMLRVWGGGIYEDDEFYRLCDKFGIMVWQDFMFSLAEYPENRSFHTNVESEVKSVIKRLRNHPSVVMWCGNNECEIDMQPCEDWTGKRYFHELIPQALKELDGTRPYLPTTPYGGPTSNSPDAGTFHGGSWFGTAIGDVRFWRKLIEVENAKFVAEFYAQGPPEMETIRRSIPEDGLMPFDGPVWEVHNPNNVYRQNLIGMTSQQALVKFTNEMMGHPESAEEFVKLAGILQGEFVKAEIDRYRTRKFRTAGCMFWMFDDTWPSISYSLVDYYLRPKPAYYYIKRAFSPIVIAFVSDNDDVSAWVVNDTAQSVSGRALISYITFGETYYEQNIVDIAVPANSSMKIWTGAPGDKPDRQVLVGKLDVGGRDVSRADYFFTTFGDVYYPDPNISTEMSYRDGTLAVTISTDQYAGSVHFEGLSDLARPDDNYFDLLPGESREIPIRRVTAEEAVRIRVAVAKPRIYADFGIVDT